MQQILKSYLKRLINISATNRSLLLRKLTKVQFIDLHEFDFAHNKPSFSIVKDLIAGKNKIQLSKVTDSRDESVNILSRRLKKLVRHEKMLFEEHGSKDLYVGWPFLRGKFSDGTHVRCPLMFFPVEIIQDDSNWILQQREDVNITLNKAFLLAYGHYNGVKISEELLERVFEDFDTDSMVFRTGLYQLFKESPVEINFNQDNFIDKLEPFKDYTKDEFDKEQKIGSIKLFPEAVLGIFAQSGSYLVPDYEFILENKSFSDLEEFFEDKIPDEIPGDRYGFLSKVKEEETYTPFKMDAFQENAIKAVKKGNSLVIQGPPGTGKSQVICNLISDYISRGKKVLVVCQKRAALDVVYNRFEDLEMSSFIGRIHDFKNDRKELYDKISKQIKSIDLYRTNINSLDALQLERKFTQHSRKIDLISEELEEFKEALFNETECGISVKELYLTSDLHGKGVNVKQEYQNFNFSEIEESYSRLSSYSSYAKTFRRDDYPLLRRKSFADNNISVLRRMQEHLEEIEAMHKEVAETTKEITGHEIELEDCLKILDKVESLKHFLSIIRGKEIYDMFVQLMKTKSSEEDLHWLTDHEWVMMDALSGEGIERSLRSEDFGKFQAALQSAIEARRNFAKYLYWRFFSKQRAWVNKILKKNNLTNSRKDLSILTKKVDNRLNLEHNLTLLNEKGWVSPYEGKFNRGALRKWLHGLKQAFRAKMIFLSLRNFNEYFSVQQMNAKELTASIDDLFMSINRIPEHWTRWQLYFTDSQLRKLTTDNEWFKQFRFTLERDFESLCEFDLLKKELESYELDAVNKVMDDLEEVEVDKIIKILDNSLRLQWIEHIETKYPVLRSVSSLKFGQLEKELQTNVKEKLKISHQILTFRAKEQTYADAEFNRLNNMVTYRELNHQVTKQRRIWPLRKLVANFSDELFHLLPCWLASPETVSAVFPMAESFDLVIFDEASQCFTERGIPAMYRGKQLVVAGDNKQLRPNDLYQVRVEEETEDVALEVDSLLELSSQYLMDVQLQGHYRSKMPELIDFSNRHFYNSNLRMLPDKEMINSGSKAIEYVKVNGVWDKQSNMIEAQTVVDLVVDLTNIHPEKDLGIVTFNAKQQDLILDLLDIKAIEEGFIVPSSLIVKNIENIQGDEKDIIIFSTAYAPDTKGKLVMQFGSLNMANGENRLNVAITRAKEKIIIVSSIWPQELKVDSAKNDGPKLLREYMEFARNVSEGNYKPTPTPTTKASASWYLKSKLEEYLKNEVKCDAKSELPFADITISNNNEYLGVISTDDDLYYQSPSIKDVHVYTPFTLSAKHWKYKGVFSRNYWQNEEGTKEELRIFVNNVQES
jgi:superfamily I DNA and/or RNA helicase